MHITSSIFEKIKRATIGSMREEVIAQNHPGLFAAMIEDPKSFDIRVHLVNNTDVRYPYVKFMTGMDHLAEDSFTASGKLVKGPYELDAYSVLELPGTNTFQMDFSVWFDLDMADEKGGSFQYRFILPKYDRKPMALPIINTEGTKVPLRVREGYSIEQCAVIKGLDEKYVEWEHPALQKKSNT